MIKIMIVDDMPIFLEYLRGCIDWKSYGFEICCEAHDGREALEKIEEYYPDVVLTDITMPYLNGLELSEVIVEKYPNISIILITGNNEFEYARKAVKIGVCDYIVKPFEKEELILSLLKLQDNINRALELQNQKDESVSSKKEEILRQMIFGKSGQTEAFQEKWLEEAGIHFQSNYFMVVSMKIKVRDVGSVETVMNWENIIMNILGGMLVLDGTYEVFRDFENDIVVILNFKDEQSMKDYKVYELTDLMKIVKNQLSLDSVICISDYAYQLFDIRTQYNNTMQILAEKEKEKGGKVWDFKKMKNEVPQVFYSLDAIEKLNHALEALNESLVDEVIDTEWQRVHSFSDEVADMNFLSSLMSVLLTNIVNAGRSVEDIFGEDFHPYEEIRELEDIHKRKDAVVAYCKKRIHYEKENVTTKSRVVMEEARSYIHENYSNADLNITDISKALFMNQTYLRKMFKSEIGMTLTEYITKYRMHIAKQLILETDKKLTAIAEEVGYSDISYFSKCFKKYYGVSPKNMTKSVYQSVEALE